MARLTPAYDPTSSLPLGESEATLPITLHELRRDLSAHLITSRFWYEEVETSRALLRLPPSMLANPSHFDAAEDPDETPARLVDAYDDDCEW